MTSPVPSRDQQAAPAQAAVAGPADAAGQAQAGCPADVAGQAGQAGQPAARSPAVAGLEPPAAEAAASLGGAIENAPGVVRATLVDDDLRAALAAIWAIVDRANRGAELSEPWRLARRPGPAMRPRRPGVTWR